MLRYIVTMIVSISIVYAGSMNDEKAGEDALIRDCLGCHIEQKLPDNLIYRRYLLRYSSKSRIEKALFSYLNHPDKSRSIMPAEFFLRFPMKERPHMNEEVLEKNVKRYIEYFDVRKRLKLRQGQDI